MGSKFETILASWKQKPLCLRRVIVGVALLGGPASSFPATGALVFRVPVLLLALDGAIRRVPAAVVHGLLFTVVALQTQSGHQLFRLGSE